MSGFMREFITVHPIFSAFVLVFSFILLYDIGMAFARRFK